MKVNFDIIKFDYVAYKQKVVETIISEYKEQQFCIPLCINKFNPIKDIENVHFLAEIILVENAMKDILLFR